MDITFTDTEVNNCFSIYHASWIISGPKRYFMCEKRSKILKSLAPAVRRWIVLANHLRANQSERAKSTIHLIIIIRQTHYQKSDWSRAFNQFIIACELDILNAISAADIAFIMSSSTSAWLPSPLECSPQKQDGWTLRFCFWGWIIYVNV